MKFTVKEVGATEQKSKQQLERDVLAAAEAKEQGGGEAKIDTTGMEDGNKGAATKEGQKEVQPKGAEAGEVKSAELNEADLLSFINKKYSKELTSVDQLFEEKKVDLPEEVQGYLEYKKTTNRGIQDYVKLSEDISSLSEDQILSKYFIDSGEAIDKEDVSILMDEYYYDEDMDEEREINKKKLLKKKAIVKAKKYLEGAKEMYKQPLESSSVGGSKEQQAELEAYNKYIAEATTAQEESQRKSNWFLEKTNEVFNDFKGFDFKIGDDTLTYNPGEAAKLKEAQIDSTNFMKKFIDAETGLVSDASGYHRALAVAMNPEKFANFFYEQGKSVGTEGVTRKMKNINMDERRAPEVSKSKDGLTIRALDAPSGRGLRIKT